MSLLIDTPVFASKERWTRFLADMKTLRQKVSEEDQPQVDEAIAKAEKALANMEVTL